MATTTAAAVGVRQANSPVVMVRGGSSTLTTTEGAMTEQRRGEDEAAVIGVVLKAAAGETRDSRRAAGETRDSRRVTFDESNAVDNEMLGQNSSKCCCVYHRPRAFGESSDEESEGDDSINARQIAARKLRIAAKQQK
eukprot:GHVS01000070.1.p1 GENE.GHVS01000070.1~~GHVS01000070.1.p1  ORF type:complete len:160 (-),score=47.24 GHVS01000070.1:164-577(-)